MSVQMNRAGRFSSWLKERARAIEFSERSTPVTIAPRRAQASVSKLKMEQHFSSYVPQFSELDRTQAILSGLESFQIVKS